MRVTPSDLEAWRSAGLPGRSDGGFDPLPLINWVTWNRLADSPVLARRWSVFASWFSPEEGRRPRQVRWRRIHRLHLPAIPQHFSWWIPTPLDLPGQDILEDEGLTVANCTATREGGFIRITGTPQTLPVEAQGRVALRLTAAERLPRDCAEHRALSEIIAAVAERFHYDYRFHAAGEYATGTAAPERWDGSCLDCALTLGALFDRQRRPWRLMGGLVVRTAIANPHFWVECLSQDNLWIPCDPTVPAVLRMLGRDWRAAVAQAVGIQDTCRLTLVSGGEGLTGLPGGASSRSTGGEAVVTLAGHTYNAFPCIDWACADCTASF